MAATAAPLLLYLRSFNHPSLMDYQSKLQQPMFSLLSFFTFIVISSSILILSLYKRLKKTEQQRSNSIIECALSKTIDENRKTHETNLTQLTHSLLLEILPSHSPKWPTLFSGDVCDEPVPNEPGLERERIDSGGEDCGKKKKKKKKRAKKKRPNPEAEDGSEERGVGKERSGQKEKQELVCLYPFTSSSSATQRKIKQQYDQLVKSNESNGLTLAQVGQFINCLIEAKNGLQHKNSQNMNIVVTIDTQASHDRFLSDSGFSRSGVIQRKFTITKALLFKADRSSFDRLHQQIYKLELEQKRLEEDAFVYNWLQQQLKLSPAYKKMLEIGACMELKAKSGEMMESTDSEFGDISFEELLAKEKKDSFWQRNGRARSCSG